MRSLALTEKVFCMSQPTVEQRDQLRMIDGRVLGYHVYGDACGQPVYFFHGFPGSHEQALLVAEQAAAAHIALVAFDRPGFGGSSPATNASIEGVAADAAALADHLRHDKFAVLGVSCGGPYALAMARLMPDRVNAVGLLAGIGPMDRPELRKEQLPVLQLMFKLAGWSPWLISPLLFVDWLMFRLSPERAVKALAGMLTKPDRDLVESSEKVRRCFGTSLSRAYVQGISGAAREAARIARFKTRDLEGIAVPVHIFQSGQDRNVPPAMGAFMAAHLAQAQLSEFPDEGHLSIVVNRFYECVARLHPGVQHACP